MLGPDKEIIEVSGITHTPSSFNFASSAAQLERFEKISGGLVAQDSVDSDQNAIQTNKSNTHDLADNGIPLRTRSGSTDSECWTVSVDPANRVHSFGWPGITAGVRQADSDAGPVASLSGSVPPPPVEWGDEHRSALLGTREDHDTDFHGRARRDSEWSGIASRDAPSLNSLRRDVDAARSAPLADGLAPTASDTAASGTSAAGNAVLGGVWLSLRGRDSDTPSDRDGTTSGSGDDSDGDGSSCSHHDGHAGSKRSFGSSGRRTSARSDGRGRAAVAVDTGVRRTTCRATADGGADGDSPGSASAATDTEEEALLLGAAGSGVREWVAEHALGDSRDDADTDRNDDDRSDTSGASRSVGGQGGRHLLSCWGASRPGGNLDLYASGGRHAQSDSDADGGGGGGGGGDGCRSPRGRSDVSESSDPPTPTLLRNVLRAAAREEDALHSSARSYQRPPDSTSAARPVASLPQDRAAALPWNESSGPSDPAVARGALLSSAGAGTSSRLAPAARPPGPPGGAPPARTFGGGGGGGDGSDSDGSETLPLGVAGSGVDEWVDDCVMRGGAV